MEILGLKTLTLLLSVLLMAFILFQTTALIGNGHERRAHKKSLNHAGRGQEAVVGIVCDAAGTRCDAAGTRCDAVGTGCDAGRNGFRRAGTRPSRANLVQGVQQTFTIGGGQSFSIASVDVASGVFGAYQSADGTGSVTFQVKSSQGVTLTGSTLTLDSSATFANTNVGVTYTYTVVPEPSAFALLGLGALGLVARRRRNA